MVRGESMAPFRDRQQDVVWRWLGLGGETMLFPRDHDTDDSSYHLPRAQALAGANKIDRRDIDGRNGGGGGGGGGSNRGGFGNKGDNSKHKDDNEFGGNGGGGNNSPAPAQTQPEATTPASPPATAADASSRTSIAVASSAPPSLPSTSTIVSSTSQPAPSSTPTVTSVVTSFAPWTSTDLPYPIASSQPRKGVDTMDSDSIIFVPSTLSEPNASGTALADSSPTDSSDNSRSSQKQHKNSSGLSPTAAKALFASGAIGAVILLGFISWIVYRTIKKSRKRRGRNFSGRSLIRFLPGPLVERVPYLRNRREAWENLDDDVPPSYETAQVKDMAVAEFYPAEKAYQMPQQQQQPTPMPAKRGKQLPFVVNNFSRSNLRNTTASQQQNATFDSVTAQYLGSGTLDSNDEESTLRSRMPDPFFNQSELARTPSDAHDPARRQVNRASELSSLSSGFGDGDIIVTEAFVKAPPPAALSASTPRLRQSRQSSNLFVGRFSWMTNSHGARRDTVFTEASEDSPPRFRSVSSWVNQQTGRIRRAQQREQADDVPPVPGLPGQVGVPGIANPPPELQFSMMMDDEVPRRVDMKSLERS